MAANEDFKAIHGHDIPLASAYRDPHRNAAADGAPNSKHLHGDAFDIDRAAVAKAKPFLNAHGLQSIGGTWHGRSEDNHFELRGANHQPQGAPVPSKPAPAMAASAAQPLPSLPTPHLQPGQSVAPLPGVLLNGSALPTESPIARQSNQFNQGLIHQAAAPVEPAQLPAPPNLQAIQQNAQHLVQSAAPVGVPEQPKGVNLIEGLGNIVNDVKGGIGSALSGIGHGITHPGELLQQAGQTIGNEAQHTNSPLDILGGLGGGAVKGVADLLNGVTSLPSDIGNSYLHRKQFAPALSIPTGDLDSYLKDKGASAFVGQALPFLAAEALTGGEATIPAAARLGKATGTGAAFGALNDSQGAGLAGRAEGATNMGALGLGLGAAGEGFGAVAKRLFPHKAVEALTPQEVEEVHNEIKWPSRAPIDNSGIPQLSDRGGFNLTEGVQKQVPQLLDQHGFPMGQGGEIAGKEILGPGARFEPGDQGLSIATRGSKPVGEDLLHGTALPAGRDLSAPAPKAEPTIMPDILPEAKSASESAQAFQAHDDNLRAAHDLAQEASTARANADADILEATGLNDPLEAQRAIGQRLLEVENRISQGQTLSAEEGARWHADRELLDHVLKSRQEELQAHDLLAQEQKTAQRSTLPAPKPFEDRLPTLQESKGEDLTRPLRSSADLVMERAGSLDDGLSNKKIENLLDFKNRKQPLSLTKDLNEPKSILPAREPMPAKPLELPGKVEPTKAEILGPNGRPLASPASSEATAGGFSAPAVVDGEHVNPSKPRTQEVIDAASKSGSQLMTIAEAQEFVKKHQPDQMQHLLNALEAGKNNQTVSVLHSPLDEGGRVTHSREVSPVDIAKRTIAPATEVKNLRSEYGSDFPAIRDNLVQRLQKAGVSVSAQEQKIDGINDRQAVTRLNKLAGRLPDSERTHVYIVDHNMNETAREGSYGFRRLDRIKESSLTGNAQNLPAGPEYANKIAPAYEAINKIMAMEGAPPEMKKIVKQMSSGKVSNRSIKQLREVLRNAPAQVLDSLCKL
jgi:hypothetical protein